MARKKEIISVTPSIDSFVPSGRWWRVKYTGADGLIYWKNIKAEDELAAYLKFIEGKG